MSSFSSTSSSTSCSNSDDDYEEEVVVKKTTKKLSSSRLTCKCRKARCKKCNLCSECNCSCKKRSATQSKKRKACDDDTAFFPSNRRTTINVSTAPRRTITRTRTDATTKNRKKARVTIVNGPTPTKRGTGFCNLAAHHGKTPQPEMESPTPFMSPCGMIHAAFASKMQGMPTPNRASTPAMQNLLKEHMKVTKPDLYAMLEDKSPPIHKKFSMPTQATMHRTLGAEIQTIGDFCDAFGLDRDEIIRRSGAQAQRMSNKVFSKDYKKEFRDITITAITAIKKITNILLPAEHTTLFQNVMQVALQEQQKALGSECTQNSIIGGHLKDLYEKMKKGSVSRRTVGAVAEYLKPLIKIINLPRGSSNQRKLDLQTLCAEGDISPKVVRREKKCTSIVEDAVAFILSNDNAQFLSWGYKHVKLSPTEIVTLPKILRKKQLAHLWEDYKESSRLSDCEQLKRAKERPLQRTKFMQLAKKITFSGKEAVKCVDYVLDNLCNNPVERMQNIIDAFFIGKEKDNFTRWLQYARNFLKVQFGNHIQKNDGDGFHSIGHSLTKPMKSTNKCRCAECLICSRPEICVNGPDKTHARYKIGDKVILMTDQKNDERVVIVTALRESFVVTRMESYVVKEVDQNQASPNEEQIAYRYELRDIPPNNVKCNACKFPYWFCNTLEKSVQKKLQGLKNKSTDSELANTRTSSNHASNSSNSSASTSKASENSNNTSSDQENASGGSHIGGSDDDSEKCTSNSHIDDSAIDSEPSASTSKESENNNVTASSNQENSGGSDADSEKYTSSENDNSDDELPSADAPSDNGISSASLLDACQVIRDCRQKFFLYTRHKTRVACQRKLSDVLEEELKEECTKSKRTSKALIVIDWKMKFEPMSQAETMTENFGKRGLPWHGVAIVYFIWDQEEERAVKKVMYIDQIVEFSSKQDALAVASLVETAIAGIRTNIPDLKEAMICSDNAGCYLSTFLVLIVSVINAKNEGEFFVSRIFHTETQDGKGLVDGHFASDMAHVGKYMKCSKSNRIIRILTAKGLANALQWNNGVQNSIVQLAQIDRGRLIAIEKYLKPLISSTKKYFGRASDISFTKPTNGNKLEFEESDSEDEMLARLDALISGINVRAHSEGEAVEFSLDFSAKKAIPGREGIVEYERLIGTYIDLDDDDDDDDDDNDDDDDLSFYDYSLADQQRREEEFRTVSEEDNDFEMARNSGLTQSSSDEDEDSTNETTDLDDEEDDDVEDDEMHIEEPRTYQVPKEEEYHPRNMVTRAIVQKASYLTRKGNTCIQRQKKKTNKHSKTKAVSPKETPSRNDVVAVGVRMAASLITTSGTACNIVDANDDMEGIYAMAESFELQPTERPYAGYARRDDIVRRDMVGARYLTDEFKLRIKEMIEEGYKDKSNKHSAGQMLERLESENRDSFSIPSIYVIQNYVGSLLNKNLKSADTDNADANDNAETRGGAEFDNKISRWLLERFRVEIDAKPGTIYEELIAEFSLDDNAQMKTKLKKKMSSLKSTLKAKAWRKII